MPNTIVEADFVHDNRKWLVVAESCKTSLGTWVVHCSVREWVRCGRRESLLSHSTGIWTKEEGVQLTDLHEEVSGLCEKASQALRTSSHRAVWLEDWRIRPPDLVGVGLTVGRDGIVYAYRPAPTQFVEKRSLA